jgi:hypothetical protein
MEARAMPRDRSKRGSARHAWPRLRNRTSRAIASAAAASHATATRCLRARRFASRSRCGSKLQWGAPLPQGACAVARSIAAHDRGYPGTGTGSSCMLCGSIPAGPGSAEPSPAHMLPLFACWLRRFTIQRDASGCSRLSPSIAASADSHGHGPQLPTREALHIPVEIFDCFDD